MEMVNHKLSIAIDGTVVRFVGNPVDVLYASGSSSGDAAYSVVNGNGTNQIMIYVPHFSAHEVTIDNIAVSSELASPLAVGVVLGAVALVGIAAVALLRRK
jgi:hypothetical protein